jgi:hypothetical protein
MMSFFLALIFITLSFTKYEKNHLQSTKRIISPPRLHQAAPVHVSDISSLQELAPVYIDNNT